MNFFLTIYISRNNQELYIFWMIRAKMQTLLQNKKNPKPKDDFKETQQKIYVRSRFILEEFRILMKYS
ncbi:hypothetical protein Hanom_Chr08g00684671 [Helianthus anomalus]